jgi:hypothetical protein
MKLDEMVTLLRSVGCDENTVTAMINAYEMGFDHGSRAYTHLTDAVEHAAEVCKRVDSGGDPYTGDFWKAMKKLKDME